MEREKIVLMSLSEIFHILSFSRSPKPHKYQWVAWRCHILAKSSRKIFSLSLSVSKIFSRACLIKFSINCLPSSFTTWWTIKCVRRRKWKTVAIGRQKFLLLSSYASSSKLKSLINWVLNAHRHFFEIAQCNLMSISTSLL